MDFHKNVIFNEILECNLRFYEANLEGLRESSPQKPLTLSPTVLCVCRGWGSSDSFQPEAVTLVMAWKRE
jgi:hypothetical protein